MRCACKRMKRKIPCSEVGALLVAAGRARGYDAATSLRLLSCDADCKREARKEVGVAAVAAPSASLAAAQQAVQEGRKDSARPPHSLSKAEKAREREAREREREAQQAQQASRHRLLLVVRIAVLILVVGGGLVLASTLLGLLRFADKRAREAWGGAGEL